MMRYAGTARKVLCGVLLIPLVVPCAGAASLLRYENGRFSGQLQDAEVTAVLADVARLARVEIRGRPLAPTASVDLELRGASLHRALTQILSRQSFLVFYRGERPVRVVLVAARSTRTARAEAGAPGEPDERSVTATTLPDGASTTVAPAAVAGESAQTADIAGTDPAAASNRPVTIHGELAQALGKDSISLSDVTAVAAHDPDPAVRAEALRVGLSILEDESELSHSFLQVLEQRDDAALADWLTRVAGENALEIARGTARETSIAVLRERARAIEQYLVPVQ